MCVPTGLITRGATGGERVLEARSTSCISYFGYEHVSKIRRNTFNTLTKAMYYLILLIIHIPAPPPSQNHPVAPLLFTCNHAFHLPDFTCQGCVGDSHRTLRNSHLPSHQRSVRSIYAEEHFDAMIELLQYSHWILFYKNR